MKKLLLIILFCWITVLILVYSLVFITKLAWNNAKTESVFDTEVVYITNTIGEYEDFEITAYTAGKESTGKTESHALYGITASGEPALERITIACPKSMSFGTKVYIPAFETVFTCMDRGSAITEGKLDVYMEDIVHAQMFGRQKLQALVLP